MFDRLIESTSVAAAAPPRRRYFATCAVVLCILFLTAVVASLYAADISLGTDEFEMSLVVAPVTPEAPDPEPPAPQRTSAPQTAEQTTRQSNTLRIEENPIIPTSVSTMPKTQLSRPATDFIISSGPERDIGANVPNAGRVCESCSGSSSSGNETGEVARAADVETAPPPPPARKPEPPKQVSLGVINGKALDLPKPVYPAAATAVGAQGKVDVQVTINEDGKVISAKAASGHPLLRQAAEKAAWQAKFSPTYLSNVAVKVTGVIVYNFTR